MNETILTRFRDVHEALCHPGLRQSLYDAGEVIMKDVLLTLHGEPHKQRRHLELRLFRRNYANFYEQQVFPATLQQVLAPMVEQGEMDLIDFGYRVTMNLTADFAGIDRPEGSSRETEKLLAITRSFSAGATIVHSERRHEDVIKEVKSAQQSFREFLEPSWRRRADLITQFEAGNISEDDLPRDVLTVLLRNQDNVALSDEVIEREIGFYLQAGSHSTANSMVHAIHELFTHTSYASLADDLVRLQRCIHESMRLHPASPVAWRTPTTSLNVAGHDLEPGDRLVLSIEQANRDVSVFGADAEIFNPDRQPGVSKVDLYGLTFGRGVHMCTGRDLDGGVPSGINDQFGIVTRLVQALLRHGMRPHPGKQPAMDKDTTRANWGYYPVVFSSRGDEAEEKLPDG